MNKQDENLKFKKTSISQNQRDNIKSILIERYGLSLESAERVLSQIENDNNVLNNESGFKNLDFQYNSDSDDFSSSKHIFKKKEKVNVSISQPEDDKQPSLDNVVVANKSINNNILNNINQKFKERIDKQNLFTEKQGVKKSNINNNLKKKSINAPLDDNKKKENSFVSSTNDKQFIENIDTKNVDLILENILPDYHNQVSINVDHVDLTFEVQNEKIDTLKESFIRTLKGDKSQKIKVHALKDISFQIYKGEKVGIIGYNGAGKSTLLNVITGIYPPDKGSVTTYGKISPLLSLGAGFDYNFSGRKNIILNGAVLGYEKEYLESKMDEIIEFSELGEFIDIPIKNYSSGMLAKLGFSIATMVNPDILIIDEILGVGDVNFVKKSADKIKSLMDGGTTVLIVSHSIPQIRSLCDKAIWIDDGSLRAIGDVNIICDEYLEDAKKASIEQLANIELSK